MKNSVTVTKYSSYNFGAVLQTYALQKKIISMGYENSILDFERPKKPFSVRSLSSLSGIVNSIYYSLNKKNIEKGYSRFDDFINNEYILTKKYDNYDSLCKEPPNADVFFCGSDQVWNPMKIQDVFFLRFVPNSVRASYAASIGVSKIPFAARRVFEEYLEDIDFISLREKKAKENIESIIKKDCEVNIDPVLLLKKEEWLEKASFPNLSNDYILCYILYRPPWLNAWLKKIHKETGLKIVLISSNGYRNVYHNKMILDAGPKEFIGLINNAKFVISSSFHGVAMSIALHKNFYAVVNPDMPDRIENVLQTSGLCDRIADGRDLPDFAEPNWEQVDAKLETERKKSAEYIAKVFDGSMNGQEQKKEESVSSLTIKNISIIGEQCTACTVCREVCSRNAIDFETNEEGFAYPKVDEDKCINCGLCLSKCHVLDKRKNTKETCKVVYGWNKDSRIRDLSSSGGIFSLFSDVFTSRGDVVVGSVFNAETKAAEHRVSNEISADKFRRSKYVESSMNDVLRKIDREIKNGKKVLFSGTPCQCAGVRRKFGDNDNLYLCDFFCHGVPSQLLFKDFLKEKEKRNSSKITDYQFRTKHFGWAQHGVYEKYSSGKEKDSVGRCEGYFVSTMIDNMFLRKSCYTCNKSMYHSSDITLGDFWGIGGLEPEENKKQGISVLTINSDKGRELIESIKDLAILKEAPKYLLDYAFTVKVNDGKTEKRNRWFAEYLSVGYHAFYKKYYAKRLMLSKIKFALFRLKSGK